MPDRSGLAGAIAAMVLAAAAITLMWWLILR